MSKRRKKHQKNRKKYVSDKQEIDDEIITVSRPKDTEAPKRPMSSYFLYRAEKVKSLEKMKPGDASKLLATQWKVLDEEEKKPWVDEADELREKWKIEMAEHKKSPAYREHQRDVDAWKRKKRALIEAKLVKPQTKWKPEELQAARNVCPLVGNTAKRLKEYKKVLKILHAEYLIGHHTDEQVLTRIQSLREENIKRNGTSNLYILPSRKPRPPVPQAQRPVNRQPQPMNTYTNNKGGFAVMDPVTSAERERSGCWNIPPDNHIPVSIDNKNNRQMANRNKKLSNMQKLKKKHINKTLVTEEFAKRNRNSSYCKRVNLSKKSTRNIFKDILLKCTELLLMGCILLFMFQPYYMLESIMNYFDIVIIEWAGIIFICAGIIFICAGIMFIAFRTKWEEIGKEVMERAKDESATCASDVVTTIEIIPNYEEITHGLLNMFNLESINKLSLKDLQKCNLILTGKSTVLEITFLDNNKCAISQLRDVPISKGMEYMSSIGLNEHVILIDEFGNVLNLPTSRCIRNNNLNIDIVMYLEPELLILLAENNWFDMKDDINYNVDDLVPKNKPIEINKEVRELKLITDHHGKEILNEDFNDLQEKHLYSNWNIGIIVGPSGCGKPKDIKWDCQRNIATYFKDINSFKELCMAVVLPLNSGFSYFDLLTEGGQVNNECVLIDEFMSYFDWVTTRRVAITNVEIKGLSSYSEEKYKLSDEHNNIKLLFGDTIDTIDCLAVFNQMNNMFLNAYSGAYTDTIFIMDKYMNNNNMYVCDGIRHIVFRGSAERNYIIK